MSFRRLFELSHLKRKILYFIVFFVFTVIVSQLLLFNGNNSATFQRWYQHSPDLPSTSFAPPDLGPRGVTNNPLVYTATGTILSGMTALPTGVTGLFDRLWPGRRQTPPMPKSQEVIHFDDEERHVHDQSKVADDLAKKIRLLCWVMTSPENHKSKAIHVQATWGKRCDKLLFASEKDDGTLPFIVVNVSHGRDHLTAKTMVAFDHVFKHHIDEYDWFLKADDDTYVIVENMKYFLSSQDPAEPVFFGHHFKPYVQQGYFSGGAGYILSKEALRRFGTRQPGKCRSDDGAEDVEMGRCMSGLGVRAGDSRDALGRSRFHCFDPETHIHGGYPDWYYAYDKYGGKKGIESISDYAITFHYVSVEKMYNLEFYIYHLRPYGIINGLQDLNLPSDKNKLQSASGSATGVTPTNPVTVEPTKILLAENGKTETKLLQISNPPGDKDHGKINQNLLLPNNQSNVTDVGLSNVPKVKRSRRKKRTVMPSSVGTENQKLPLNVNIMKSKDIPNNNVPNTIQYPNNIKIYPNNIKISPQQQAQTGQRAPIHGDKRSNALPKSNPLQSIDNQNVLDSAQTESKQSNIYHKVRHFKINRTMHSTGARIRNFNQNL